ncbi:MAG: dienelactone hydrolase family protein, partial [Pseudomonadota bacterium]
MCDEKTVRDSDAFLRASGLTRRRFGALAATTAMATLLPAPADAMEVVEQDVMVATPDGEADCYLAHPSTGKHPAVIVWPDVLSLRPAFRA